MLDFRKTLCLLLVLCLVGSVCPVTVAATDDPLSMKDFDSFGAAATEPEETQPVQEPEVPETESAPEETVPAETEPALTATEPVETQPETEPVEETEPTEASASTEETEPSEEEPDEPVGHCGIPLYFQTDYPNNMFGVGTIASNGCSITSLAMVATYMTGHEYLPDELARYFGGAAENNIARLETGSDALRLPYHKSENWHETLDALHDGKIAIALMDGDSIFTDSQHFIILAGLTEDGKILVNDSFGPNYSHWNLKRGLKEGFDPSAILLGYSGAWIYDKSAMPEEPFIYHEDLPVRGEPRYGIELTLQERQLLAKVVWVEARGECMEGQQAVAEVVFNRMVSDQFPDSVYQVIHGQGQFRSVPFLEDAEPYQMQYEAIENALYGPYVLPEDVYYFATTPANDNVWGSIGGHIFCYGEYSEPVEETEPAAEPVEETTPAIAKGKKSRDDLRELA